MDVLVQVLQWFTDPAHWTGSDGIPTRLVEHVELSAEAVLIGGVIALPIGVLLGHYGRFSALAMNVSNVGRAIPSIALLVLAFQVFGLGNTAIIIPLVALAIPPMVTNSYTALSGVDPDVKEAARGMGFRELAQIVRVELPLSVPLLMAGIRTSAVQVVATATLAALIAGGGFGRYIIDGFGQQDYTKLVAGGILVALLALATEGGLSGVERLLIPRGIRLLSAPETKRVVFKTA